MATHGKACLGGGMHYRPTPSSSSCFKSRKVHAVQLTALVDSSILTTEFRNCRHICVHYRVIW